MRELEMEELDKVIGGSGVYTTNGFYEKKEFAKFARSLAEISGYDVAGAVICQMVGLAEGEVQQAGDIDTLINRVFSICLHN